MTLERSTYQISSDRINELLGSERDLFTIKDLWNNYKQAKFSGRGGSEEFMKLATKLDALTEEKV